MERGANTTYVRYRLARGSRPLELAVSPLTTDRELHGATRAGAGAGGGPGRGRPPRAVRRRRDPAASPRARRRRGPPRRLVDRLPPPRGDRPRPARPERPVPRRGRSTRRSGAGRSWTLVLSAEDDPDLDGEAAPERRIRATTPTSSLRRAATACRRSCASWSWRPMRSSSAATPSPRVTVTLADGEGRSIIAGYHWFDDWGRDTMIALPGLTLATGRPGGARRSCATFAPLRRRRAAARTTSPTVAGETPEYNTVDATLWYVQAIRAYHAATGDDAPAATSCCRRCARSSTHHVAGHPLRHRRGPCRRAAARRASRACS